MNIDHIHTHVWVQQFLGPGEALSEWIVISIGTENEIISPIATVTLSGTEGDKVVAMRYIRDLCRQLGAENVTVSQLMTGGNGLAFVPENIFEVTS